MPRAARLVLLKNAGEPLVLSYRQLNALNRDASEIEGLLGTHPIDVSVMSGGQSGMGFSRACDRRVLSHSANQAGARPIAYPTRLDNAEGNPVCVISDRLWKTAIRAALRT